MAGLTNRVYVRHSDPGAPLFTSTILTSDREDETTNEDSEA